MKNYVPYFGKMDHVTQTINKEITAASNEFLQSVHTNTHTHIKIATGNMLSNNYIFRFNYTCCVLARILLCSIWFFVIKETENLTVKSIFFTYRNWSCICQQI
jgi:hypothetical protein